MREGLGEGWEATRDKSRLGKKKKKGGIDESDEE